MRNKDNLLFQMVLSKIVDDLHRFRESHQIRTYKQIEFQRLNNLPHSALAARCLKN